MSGLAPSVANLFAQHSEAQQQQPQQPPMQPFPHPAMMALPPHLSPMHAQAYPPQPFPQQQPFHFQPPPPPHAFQGQPFPPQMQQMHPHAQLMMQQQQQQQPPHQMMYVSPPAPPPSRQVSQLEQSGPGSLLSMPAESEALASAVGVAIVSAPQFTMALSPDDKHLGGEEHASTPCAELSSIPRSMDEPVGCLIAHQAGATVFALKAGLARLLYAPSSKSVDAHSSSSDAHQSEVLKGHASSVLDIAFLPQESSEELASRGVKLEAGQRASFVATLSSSLIQVYQILATEGQAKVACKLAFSVPGQQMSRLRIGRNAEGRSSIAVLSSSGSVHRLDPWPLLISLQGAAAPASALEPLPFSGSVVDVTWADRQPLFTDGKSWTHAGATHAAASPIERVISIPGTASVLITTANADASSKTLSVHRVADGELVSSVTLTHADLLFSAVEVAPTGEFVAVAYRRSEATGEASDAGFFVLQLSSEPRGVPADTCVFVFVSVFFQPSPIVSFSLAAAEVADGSFDVFAVEQKPIVRLHIARQAVSRAIQADEVIRSAAAAPPAISASDLLAASTSSGIAHGQGEVTGDDDEHRDAVPALRSSLPPLLAAQDSSHSDSPPSPAIVAFSGAAAAVSSAPSSASNSRMQSPAVSRVDRPDFNQIDHPLLDGTGIDYSSGRSSPNHAASPLKPVLRPRGNSTGETGRGVHFAAGGPASSQPTPNSTPGPGTPSGIRGMSSLESSEASSPLPSPLPSPRSIGSLAGSRGLSDPSSPFQPQTGSVATTTDVSAAQSPFVSSNSSPLISPSPTPAPPVLDESGITSIPSTPSHHAQPAPGSSSSTATPAPTPQATGGVRLSQMSTADVSLHFLSAVDPNRSGAGGTGQSTMNTPMNTPMVTPASSVPNTPRGSVAVPPRKSSLIGGNFSLTSGVNVAPTPASLRVRTQSGSTSPSPISSPSFASSGVPSASGQKYHRVRSQSMDKADSFSGGRMLAESQMVEPVPEEGSAIGPSSPADVHLPRPSSASSGLVTKPIASAHDSASKSSGKQSQEQNLVRVLDQLFGRHFGRLSGIMASERLQMQQEEQKRMEQLTAMIVQNVSGAVGDRVTGAIDSVCESSLVPAVTEAIAQQMAAAGGGAGVGAGGAGASVDSASIVSGLRAPLQESFRSAFVSTLLPSFESSIKQMLVQIQASVAVVTQQASAASSKSAADEANQAAQRRRAEEEEKKARLFERAESARREKALSAQVAEMHEIITALAQSQLKLTQTVAEMKGMIAVGVANSAGAARAPAAAASSSSPAAPPTPSSVDLTAEIGSLLQSEQFDRAFTLALSSGKLKAVKFACAQLDPRTLLTTTVAHHRLSSPVVLSLIQQLAASLQVAAAASLASPADNDLRIAINWLRESVMAVKVDDPTIAAHVKPILKQASAQAEQLQLPAHHPMFDSLRMLQQLLQLKSAN